MSTAITSSPPPHLPSSHLSNDTFEKSIDLDEIEKGDEEREKVGEGEVEEEGGKEVDPLKKYEKWKDKKWFILILVALPCLVVSMAGSPFLSSLFLSSLSPLPPPSLHYNLPIHFPSSH